MRSILFLIYLTFSSSALSQSQTFQTYSDKISDEYPSARFKSGSFSLLFGSLAVYGGSKTLTKSKPLDEQIVGASLGTIGLLRLVDGGLQMTRKEPGEEKAANGELITSTDFEKASQVAQERRKLRTALVASSALLYTYLYLKGDKDYQGFIYSAVILTVIAIMQYQEQSIEEKVWSDIKDDNLNNLVPFSGIYFMPSSRGAELGYSFNF